MSKDGRREYQSAVVPPNAFCFWLVCLSVMGTEPGVELRHLRYVAVIAQRASFTRAAGSFTANRPACA